MIDRRSVPPLASERVKTRTLLLLALACGLAIMLAGAVFLFQLAGQDDVSEAVPIGEPVDVGDLTIEVEAADEADGVLSVGIRIAGVDDPDGAAGFRLIASGRPIAPVDTDAPDACAATTVAESVCVVRFDVSSADGSSRVLFYERGEEQARWVLS
ncbi:hypothetical protein BDK89_2873 [Ilumatobacter fluminis]|uniref:Uncharacterized protein n=1 Tax=Ilumatobacter fluminis TaxID=467091 RepID=A0A4R7I1G0_9ACTN|nr:hypothetical protein BDK89_2873 [Ilumatobacter fluminis]